MSTAMVTGQALPTGPEQFAPSESAATPAMPSDPAMRRLEKAAEEFEGILMASVWQAWNKSDKLGNTHDPIGDSMTGMGMEMASMVIAEKGGMGIARMIVSSLKKEVTGQKGN